MILAIYADAFQEAAQTLLLVYTAQTMIALRARAWHVSHAHVDYRTTIILLLLSYSSHQTVLTAPIGHPAHPDFVVHELVPLPTRRGTSSIWSQTKEVEHADYVLCLCVLNIFVVSYDSARADHTSTLTNNRNKWVFGSFCSIAGWRLYCCLPAAPTTGTGLWPLSLPATNR